MLYRILPRRIKIPLFGNRAKYGKTPFSKDKDWGQWISSFYFIFYRDTQKKGISNLIPVKINYWPFGIKLFDINLIISFIAKKGESNNEV